jgi:cobalamin-dependent methionine synthase I
MKILGEKIDGTRKRVKEAVLGQGAAFIQELAADQAAAGATWIDVNAGMPSDAEGRLAIVQ